MRNAVIRSGAVALGIASIGRAVSAAEYRLTKIAEGQQLPTGLPLYSAGPAIDSSGRVVFRGSVGGVEGIYAGSGGALQPILTVGAQYKAFSSAPDVNASGTVAFTATRQDGGLEVITWRDGQLATIASTSGGANNFGTGHVSVNDAGDVAYMFVTATDTFIKRTRGGVVADVASAGELAFEKFGPPSLSDDGTVVFWAQGHLPGVVFPDQRIFAVGDRGLNQVDGGIVDGLDDDWGKYPTVNAAGQVLFQHRGGTLLSLGDVAGSGVRYAGAASSFALNDVGGIVGAGGGGGYVFEIRPDTAVGDFIYRWGDPLLGSEVVATRFFQNGLNDAGQVAFEALLADGRAVVLRADPVPEPGSGLVVVAAGALLLRRRRR